MENIYLKLLNNPFRRGYDRFTIDRTLVITSENSDRLIYFEMTKEQQSQQDWNYFGKNCLFDNNRVYLLDSTDVPTSSQTRSGRIVSVIYQIYGYTGMFCNHIGDAVTMEAARNVMHEFSFMPGQYEKCWQISDKHLPASVFSILQKMFYDRDPQNDLLEIFPIHTGNAMGILLNLPEHHPKVRVLPNVYTQYRNELLALFGEQAPECLIDLLSLAYIAGTRMLIMSNKAHVLYGLPTFHC